MTTLGALLSQLTAQLKMADIEMPLLDARLLVGLALGQDRQVYAHEDMVLDADTMARLDAMLARRLAGVPISRIRGWREFWSMRFDLSPDCLDPRPDSETLVAAALEQQKHQPTAPLIMDYGTGSGCLLLAILSEWHEASGIGLDKSPDAITTATANARYHQLNKRARYVVSDWCAAIKKDMKADIIISNPPYIPTNVIKALKSEVRDYDPPLAIDGGSDGYAAWRVILPKISARLKPEGMALVEIGKGQDCSVIALAQDVGLICHQQWRDLSGIIRVLGLIKMQ